MGGMLLPAASSPPLSRVATSSAHGEDSPYFAGWRAYDDDPYDAVTNPGGVIQMGLAENQVSFDLLEGFLREHPEAAGWGGARHSSNGFQVTVAALEAAYEEAAAAGMSVRGVLLTNPSNPLGTTVERSALEDVLDFVVRKNIHLISDEIYSGSVFAAPDLVSVAELVESRGDDVAGRVHIVYSLSKDLGLPGFRVGVVYSYNDAVVTAARRMSSFTLVSSQTQKTLAAMLSDAAFAQEYIRTNRERLRVRHDHMVAGLARSGVPCLPSNAGLFVWMDMRRLLRDGGEATVADELRLWDLMLREVKLNISPGSSCHCSEPGWFRVCFANMSLDTLDVALARMSRFMDRWNKATTLQEQH
ncbi:unnamed protein product [Triticum turgidum subsp. durum]|uniref:Aminotransferase class I/classII large domain-containing protein n=1 Tax=Triticum turgidum subsp. durum TaxID=4567 RepID=A0A9R0RD54_TRITD|nr:unnamed protein product [Triticum turgidum subsp. durum]